MSAPRTGTVLAFDFGEKRIGVAVGDLALRIAHPLTTLEVRGTKALFAAIATLVGEWRPAEFVVGMPSHADDRPHEIARLARRFAQRLTGRFRCATHLIDERLTSHAATAALREQGVRAARRAAIDAAAAQLILQTYFEDERGACLETLKP